MFFSGSKTIELGTAFLVVIMYPIGRFVLSKFERANSWNKRRALQKGWSMRLKKLRERVRAIFEEFCSDEEGYSEEEGKEGCSEEGCTSDDQRYKEEAECSEVVRITNEDVASSFACDVVYTNTPNTKASKQGWLKGIRKTNSELRTLSSEFLTLSSEFLSCIWAVEMNKLI
jgi:hypothetical protein